MIDATKTMERARRKLGAPIIDVELTDEQMTSLLKDAQETFYLYANLVDMPISKQDRVEDAWIKKYFYALCKETLGRIRGKYDGKIPIPGQELTLDYESLLLEADREKCFLKYIIFQEKELLSCAKTQNAVFVFYINVRGLDEKEVPDFIESLSNKFKKPGFTNYFIPTRDGETRIECIYPVNKEFNEERENVIGKLNDYLDELTNKNKENLIGRKVTLDLGNIGPVQLTVESIDETLKVIFLRYDSGKIIDLYFEDFEKLSGIKIKKDEQ